MATNEYFKRRRADRKAKGLCDMCGKPAAEGMVRCNECGIAHRIAERQRCGCQPYSVTGNGKPPVYEGEES